MEDEEWCAMDEKLDLKDVNSSSLLSGSDDVEDGRSFSLYTLLDMY